MQKQLIAEEEVSFEVPAIKVKQPIGEFFIASMPSTRLCEISYFDVRRMLKERDIETYLGIQRPLNKKRVEELEKYVRTYDACFPTAVILAIESCCATYDDQSGGLTIRNVPQREDGGEPVYYRNIARVLDGQHRIAGLESLSDPNFEVNVSIFIDMDIEDQAYVFSTVNLAQTKVNPSLAYDLFELSRARSPQKTCHNVAVALDRNAKSPFYKRIKRLGVSTPGRSGETISQATFVKSLLRLVSHDPNKDRDTLLRGGTLRKPSKEELVKMPFRGLFVDEQDLTIADIVWNYFSAIRNRWPTAWDSTERGNVLPRTNGFKALMNVLPHAYLRVSKPGEKASTEAFLALFEAVQFNDDEFTVERFKPGTSGESELTNALMSGMGLDKSQPNLL